MTEEPLPPYVEFPWKGRKLWKPGEVQEFTLVYDGVGWRAIESGHDQESTASGEGQSG